MRNIEMPLLVNIKTRPTVSWGYGQQLLKVTLRENFDSTMAKQLYKESIGYEIQYF